MVAVKRELDFGLCRDILLRLEGLWQRGARRVPSQFGFEGQNVENVAYNVGKLLDAKLIVTETPEERSSKQLGVWPVGFTQNGWRFLEVAKDDAEWERAIPQQGVLAAVAVGFAVIPYCIARSVQMLTDDSERILHSIARELRNKPLADQPPTSPTSRQNASTPYVKSATIAHPEKTSNQPHTNTNVIGQTITCPSCSETVPRHAYKCPSCSSTLSKIGV